MLNVGLLYTGSPRAHSREMASQLLHVLSKRFLMDENIVLTTASQVRDLT